MCSLHKLCIKLNFHKYPKININAFNNNSVSSISILLDFDFIFYKYLSVFIDICNYRFFDISSKKLFIYGICIYRIRRDPYKLCIFRLCNFKNVCIQNPNRIQCIGTYLTTLLHYYIITLF